VPEIAAHVRALRKEIGETYKEFAAHLGVAQPTAVRYERERRPPPKILARLEQIASTHGLSDLADVFHSALADELKVSDTVKWGPLPTHEESRFIQALLTVFRDPAYRKKAAYVRKALDPVIKKLDFADVTLEAQRAIARLLKKGRSLDAIRKRHDLEEVARAFFNEVDAETFEVRHDEIVCALFRAGWSIKRIIDEFRDDEDAVMRCASTEEFISRLGDYEEDMKEAEESEEK
jgi:transcriptional regulator with XRE-family HTH domain